MLLLSEYEKGVLAMAPGTEFGKLFFRIIQHEIEEARQALDLSAKISKDPISEDWRCKWGEIKGMKRVLSLPNRYTNNQ
uniref:Uncharacterized protein n=1 Tax=viral metagenome TaxID=1070528 RepID=A0A6H1ZLI1_9ZZZZ